MLQFNNNNFKERSIRFNLRAMYKTKNGERPIVVNLRYMGDRKEINTGLNVPEKHWDVDQGCVSASDKNGMVINRELMKIQNGIEERFRKMQTELGDITLNELADSLKGKTKAPETIVAYLDVKISELKNRIGIDLAQTTFYKFN